MKFTAGQWQSRPGVKAHYATLLFETELTADMLMAVALVRPRGPGRVHTLDATLLTAQISSPMAELLRARLAHFAGARSQGPAFELQPQPASQGTLITPTGTRSSSLLPANEFAG